MSQLTYSRCICCKLAWKNPPNKLSVDERGHCAICRYHLSAEAEQTIKRHSEHEELLRTRLAAADTWARDVAEENKELKQKNYWAYRARDKVANLLHQIADVHNMRPNGACICESKNCRTAKILDNRLAQRLIADIDNVQSDMRRREQISRELRYVDDADDWDALMPPDLNYLSARPQPQEDVG